MQLSAWNFLSKIKNLVTGGGVINGDIPVSTSGFLKRAEAVTLSDLATTLVNSSGGTDAGSIAAGVGIEHITFPINLAAGPMAGTSAADLVTTFLPGYRFKLLGIDFVTDVAGTGAGASQTVNLEIGTTNVTTGTLVVTEAGTTPVGKVIEGAAVTGANIGLASDSFSIELAASGTAFTGGRGSIIVTIQNLDVADAFTSLLNRAGGTADETNARVFKVPANIDTIGNIAWKIPRDYDEATDTLVLRVLASQLTLSTDNDVKLDVELYRKRAAVALSADLAPSFSSDTAVPVLSTAEQWLEFDLSRLTFRRDDVATIELITDGHNDTAGEEVLIHAVELVYRSTLVSYDRVDSANVSLR